MEQAISAAMENTHFLEIGSVVEVPQGVTLSINNSANQEPLRYLIVKAHIT